MSERIARATAVVVAVVALTVLAGCGYALAGRGNTLPAHVRVIGIPPFINQSNTPDIDVRLQEAVRAEFANRGRFKIEPTDQNVDAVMITRITNVALTALNFDAQRGASQYNIIVTASIEFKDMRNNGKVLWADPAFQERDQYDVTNAANASDVTALLRTDTNAIERLAKKFSRAAVTAILESF